MVSKIIIALIILLPVNYVAAKNCSWVNNNICPQELAYVSDVNMCVNTQPSGICCCEQDYSQKKLSTKIIIIGSVVIVLGIATILSFLLKKNEYEE